jgi:hypothetical protein
MGVHEHVPREGEIERHQEGRPVHTVEPGFVSLIRH